MLTQSIYNGNKLKLSELTLFSIIAQLKRQRVKPIC